MEGDAFPVIENYLDHKNMTYFIDPPYTVSGKKAGKRIYLHHNIDHRRLFKMFQNVKGDFLFTYNSSEELMIMAHEKDFQSKLISMKNTHHNVMTELVIGRNLSWVS
jgi:DNA adenine methylase